MPTFDALYQAVNGHVSPYRPPAQHWLSPDHGYSFCYPCAKKHAFWCIAFGNFSEDELNAPRDFPSTNPAQLSRESGSAYQRGRGQDYDRKWWWDEATDCLIDGGCWYSGSNNDPVYCEDCGKMLQYQLAPGPHESELAEWARSEFSHVKEDGWQVLQLMLDPPDELKTEVGALAARYLRFAAGRRMETSAQ